MQLNDKQSGYIYENEKLLQLQNRHNGNMKLLQSSLVVLLLNFADADWWESGSYYQIYPRSFKDSDG